MRKQFTKDGVLFTGNVLRKGRGVLLNPSEQDLLDAGYTEVVDTPSEQDNNRTRMAEIEAELASMDYLTSKYIDGEDMTEYGDWQAHRKALREEYRALEKTI